MSRNKNPKEFQAFFDEPHVLEELKAQRFSLLGHITWLGEDTRLLLPSGDQPVSLSIAGGTKWNYMSSRPMTTDRRPRNTKESGIFYEGQSPLWGRYAKK